MLLRYRYHSPKFYRGPLHPVQPLPSTDPAARDYSPGPFNLPRLRQTHQSTISPDLLTLAYQHIAPGTPDQPERIRLREWEGESPYFKNRPKRGPRGNDVLFPLENDITFRNIPEIRAVSLAMFMPHAKQDPGNFVVAKSIMQNISGVKPTKTKTKRSVSEWGIIKGESSGFKCTIHGNQALEFMDKVIHLVFPKIKEWPGVKGEAAPRLNGYMSAVASNNGVQALLATVLGISHSASLLKSLCTSQNWKPTIRFTQQRSALSVFSVLLISDPNLAL
jgi:large subunit ribosomal protein L5